MNAVLQTLFIQRVIFGDAPPPHMRRALRQAGFRYTGAYWECTTGNAGAVSHGYIMQILDIANGKENQDSAIAPTVTH